MDSHVFRLVAAELARLLDGARMEKIHGPAPGVFTFGLFARGAKLRLLLKTPARIDVFDPEPGDEVLAWETEGVLALHRRPLAAG